jgi:hypothetical protein
LSLTDQQILKHLLNLWHLRVLLFRLSLLFPLSLRDQQNLRLLLSLWHLLGLFGLWFRLCLLGLGFLWHLLCLLNRRGLPIR